MIARVWHGYATHDHADAYEAMLKPELLPGLSTKSGFAGSYLLRRDLAGEVEFITMILWESLDDIRAVAGDDYERAIVPEESFTLARQRPPMERGGESDGDRSPFAGSGTSTAGGEFVSVIAPSARSRARQRASSRLASLRRPSGAGRVGDK